jgi:hypothetical protein
LTFLRPPDTIARYKPQQTGEDDAGNREEARRREAGVIPYVLPLLGLFAGFL